MAVSQSYKRALMMAGACGLVASLVPSMGADAADAWQSNVQLAQLNNASNATPQAQTPATSGTQGQALPPDVSRGATEEIIVKAKRLLQKEKDSPSAVTELGSKQIEQTGVGGSVATLLRQAPSVFVYQQGIGNNEPVLSIRGVRGLEVAQTLDDVPMQDLLNGGTGAYLTNNIGGRFNLDQISGVTIYPGVAYPDKNTFGTIGGTVAYNSKRPTNDYYTDVFGSVGSFQTYNEGFTFNSGAIDGPLGSGDNAPKVLLQYSNLQTAGFIDYTPARYNNVYFAFDKPFDDGLSKVQGTILYNTGNGLIQSEPTPLPYLNKNGLFSNYSPNILFQRETNDYLSILLKGDKYINDTFQVGVTAFYLNSDSQLTSYGSPALYNPDTSGRYITGGAAPFVQTFAGFGYFDDFFGPNGGTQGFDASSQHGGGQFYFPGHFTYDPSRTATNSKACPGSTLSGVGGGDPLLTACGLTGQTALTHNDSYGIQPRISISPPEFYGINNAIRIGALIAKETQPTGPTYAGIGPNVPTDAGHLVSGFDGGSFRAIFQFYAQDKIELLGNTLHITPGFTLEGTTSGNKTSAAFVSADPAYPGVVGYEPFKAKKWDRELLPFLHFSYDFDKILPALKGTTVYASTGESALFAPATDFTPNTSAGTPYASIVHLYEAGIQYDTSNIAAHIDYFYQKVDRDFGFFQGQAGPIAGQAVYTNDGQREFKGIEAAGDYRISPNWEIGGNVSHTLAKYLKTYLASTTVFQDQFGLAQRGTPNSGVPDWLSTFYVEYDRKSTFRDGDAIAARLEGQYTGQQYTTFDLTGLETNVPTPSGIPLNATNPNTNAPYPVGYIPYLFKVGATTYDPKGRLPAFALFNLDLTYTVPTPMLPAIKRVKFDLNVQNLFNQHFFQYFYNQISPSNCGNFKTGPFKGLPESNYSCGGAFNDGLPGEPFAVTFTVTARF